MAQYDEAILIEMADRLYGRAARLVIFITLVGLAFGGAAARGMASHPDDQAFYMMLGAIFGGGVAYFIGQGRAFMLKLQAQSILVQVQIERNTRPRG